MDKEQLEQIKKRWEYEDYKDVDDLINEVELQQAIIDELIDTLHHEGIDTKQIIEEVKEKFPHYVK